MPARDRGGAWFVPVELGSGVRAGFTTRAGGTSTGDWAGLDLGLHVGDDPDRVRANRRWLAAGFGAPVWFGRQVHGTRVTLVDPVAPAPDLGAEPGAGPGTDMDAGPDTDAGPGGSDPGERADPFGSDLGEHEGGYDALVAARPGTAVGVLVADCVPVLLADPQAGVVAAAHTGRRGLLAGVLEVALGELIARGARPERVRAALGPSAGGCCYEVSAQVQDDACAHLPEARARTRWGTPSLDLRAGCRAVLEDAGVSRIQLVGGCTVEDGSLYSYRRAPVTGRFAGVVMMQA